MAGWVHLPGVRFARWMGDGEEHDVLSWVRPTNIAYGRNDSAQLAHSRTQMVCGHLAVVYAEDRSERQDPSTRTECGVQDRMADVAEASPSDGLHRAQFVEENGGS